MEIVSEDRFLKLPEGAIEGIRKIHNLDKPKRLAEAISILEDWIQKQDHIVKKDFSKKYLETTLIFCKGSVEKAKKQIDRICTMKTLLPLFFNLHKITLENVMELGTACPLPKMTKDYYRVIMLKISNNSLSADNYMYFYQFGITTLEYMKANDYVNGFIICADYSDINLFDHLKVINTVALQQFLNILINGYGARLINIHIISNSKAVELLIKIIKQVVSEKIGNRLHAYATIEDFQQVLPADILPVEYGGKERSIKLLTTEWVEAISSKENVEYMKMMSKACTDESKRHSAKFNDEYLGMPGSFRNLSVD